ncbi:cytochrome b subunit of succinate dehydrogenase, Sdh3p [Boletus reticuloceps]|uniref:Cytochrome b subunit of succinate dehydrogenase, Sdh3p n=1 Tax=Boletus reticuloceps TaxID=495285 RepID=A0A8I2YHE5_9AGAM|nr:cytochrome b subunit of succinate dehydrogenase, Sdh3p [Boletus reticuloceps]
MSARAVGLAPSLRQAVFAPKFARTQLALRSAIIKRDVQTQSLPPSASQGILNEQRLKRPSSPHFTIYQPQLTWLGSIAHRATGASLSALLYGFALAYLVAPGTFDSAHVIEFVTGLPDYVKTTGKLVLAAPFAFHGWNGVRHLAWDLGKFMTVKGAYGTGYAVLGATALSTVYLVWW